MPSYPPEETQPMWVTGVYAVVVIFAIIGVFSTLGFLQHLSHEQLLYGSTSITTNVTVLSTSCSDARCYSLNGFIDSENKGYVVNSVFSFSHMDAIVTGHTYTIKYFCNIIDNNDRTVMEMVDHAASQYTCVTENGVCK